MIDLHIHSSFSDGSCRPDRIMEMAEEAGLELISITDHNTVDAYGSMGSLEGYNTRLLKGCEVSCMADGVSVEVLGYQMDLDPLSRWLEGYFSREVQQEIQSRYLKKLKSLCQEAGLKFDPELEIQGNLSYTLVMRNELIRHDENKEILPEEVWKIIPAFRRLYCWNPVSPLFIDESADKPTLEETVGVIREAGGLAFLAHMYEYSIPDMDAFLDYISSDGKIDGIECFHSNFREKEISFLLDFCKEHGLLVTGGTDFHGDMKPEIKLGTGRGRLAVTFDLVSDWCR